MGKFIKLFENALSRYTTGGFTGGDLVKFKANALKDEFFKTQPDALEKVKALIGSDLNLRVTNIKPKYPTAMGASNNDYNGVDYYIEIAQELMPGKVVNHITVPACILDRVDTYPNLAPIPNSQKYDNKIQLKPKLVNSEENEEVEFYKPTPLKGDQVLANTNTKIPAKPAEGHKDPAKYTAKYLPKGK
jgi:hypothetical protein